MASPGRPMTCCLVAALAVAALVTAAPGRASAQGRLDQARDAVRGDSRSSSSSASSDSSSSDDDDDDDDDNYRSTASRSTGTTRRDGLHPAAVILAPLAGLAWIPYLFFEHRSDQRAFTSRGRFLSYPYRQGRAGQMVVCWSRGRYAPPLNEEDEEDEEHGEDEVSEVDEEGHFCETATDDETGGAAENATTFRVRGEYAYDFYGVHRPSVYIMSDTFFRLGLEAGWTHMMERLPDGETDRLNVGDVNFSFRVVQHDRIQVRSGMGWRYMADSQGWDHGFNYILGIDAFPVRPLIISADLDLGNLGKAFLVHGRLTFGANIGPAELYLGYDALLIGPVVFHGPLAGLRFWL